ncbi:MAG: hypothetical protein ABSA97_14995 [Verrucomicrobiia bacterium]
MKDVFNNPRFTTTSRLRRTTAGKRVGTDWRLLILIAALLIGTTGSVLAAAKFVNGLAPDWEQPYHYTAASPNGGPGPDPNNPANPFAPTDQWNDWCAPTAAANLAGHWADARGVPVADTTPFDSIPFPGSTVGWGVGPSWQDYLADSNRPLAQVAAGPLPTNATDIGWYMDTNLGIPYDVGIGVMGGYFFGDLPHPGTYLKNTHVGLQTFLNSRYSFSGSVFWRTGTRGLAFAGGVDPTGGVAQIHLNATSAFNEVKSEINTNRTLLLSFYCWNPIPMGPTLPGTGTNTESAFGGTYYLWGPTPSPPYTNDEDEVWNFHDDGTSLGHIVTCVGYIPQNDPDDPYHGTGNATDWVIVHDNWSTTARNVIIPFNFLGRWVANTTARPWPTAAKFVNGLVPDWNQPYRYTPPSLNGGPPPDPAAGVVNQWNAWCAPASGANLAGHWADFHGWPVADTTPFPGSTFAWAAPSWQDYLADGVARPGPTNAPGRPPNRTDIGWYMDTNRGVPYDLGGGWMGGYSFGNGAHTGTYLKDIHAGLHYFFPPPSRILGQECWVTNWVTGTRGRVFFAGWDPTNAPAQPHLNAASAFGEVMSEINTNRTLILSYLHWNVAAAGVPDLPPDGDSECDFGGSYYAWSYQPSPGNPNAEDEYWNMYSTSNGLGHAVTAVGYIPAGDVLDPGPSLQMGPTDWVIVHDNWASTPRNVIIPFDFAGNWVANTTVHPEIAHFTATKIELVAVTNVVISFTGIPGTLHNLEWKSDITNNTWSTAISNVAFTAGTMQMTNTVDSSVQQRFYRIKATD